MAPECKLIRLSDWTIKDSTKRHTVPGQKLNWWTTRWIGIVICSSARHRQWADQSAGEGVFRSVSHGCLADMAESESSIFLPEQHVVYLPCTCLAAPGIVRHQGCHLGQTPWCTQPINNGSVSTKGSATSSLLVRTVSLYILLHMHWGPRAQQQQRRVLPLYSLVPFKPARRQSPSPWSSWAFSGTTDCPGCTLHQPARVYPHAICAGQVPWVSQAMLPRRLTRMPHHKVLEIITSSIKYLIETNLWSKNRN